MESHIYPSEKRWNVTWILKLSGQLSLSSSREQHGSIDFIIIVTKMEIVHV